MGHRSDRFRERVDAARKEADDRAVEVTEHLHRAILALPEFSLKDGTTAKLDPYVEPHLDDEGQAHFGVDVLLDDGSH